MPKKHTLRTVLLVCATLPFATGMSGNCPSVNLPGGGSTCGTSNVPSVRLTIVDENGDTLPAATIAFSLNGGQYFVGSCEGDCEDFEIAYDATGQFNISVISPGYLQADRVVNVAADADDDCTPITQDLIVIMKEDTTVRVIAGAWRAQTVFGQIDLRFGANGEAIGAILYDRTVAGDGNFYVSYNGNPIRGVSGQEIAVQAVNNPTRVGDVFNFNGQALGVPIGFIDALITTDFQILSGGQPGAVSQGLFVTYQRLSDIPSALQDP
ncbi:MAG TPA: hypothetical protein P5081_12060 [Phycisphaerae bacterium]|nr:hypothetical protein [Phycisphaerae bacterium]HRW53613.1 hypothetical protein [Phycisphaerae bacterium]